MYAYINERSSSSFMVCSHCPIPRLMQRPIKMTCIALCKGFHTAQGQTPTQIPIGFCTHFIRMCFGVGQCELTITAMNVKRFPKRCHSKCGQVYKNEHINGKFLHQGFHVIK